MTAKAMREVRCQECMRLLCKATAAPVKPSGQIEIKCAHCNALNYLIGQPA